MRGGTAAVEHGRHRPWEGGLKTKRCSAGCIQTSQLPSTEHATYLRLPQLLQRLSGERQVTCRDRRGLLSDLIIALKQMPLEVRCNKPARFVPGFCRFAEVQNVLWRCVLSAVMHSKPSIP